MSETALAVVGNEQRALSRVEILEQGIGTMERERKALAEFVTRQMVEGTDYGTIPGTERKGPKGEKLPNRTLLKPGAEKLTDLFRCSPKFKIMRVDEDFSTGFFSYMFRVQLVQRDVGQVVAEGFGSCNSYEGRYRWRDAQRKCPKCEKATIFQDHKTAAGGFYCWGKKGGCGAKFPADDTSITTQVAGRVQNDDMASVANTVLKMAKKRALVDGAIALARCSDLFTQDAEDLAELAKPAEPPPEEDIGESPMVTRLLRDIAEARTLESLEQIAIEAKKIPVRGRGVLKQPWANKHAELKAAHEATPEPPQTDDIPY